MNKVYMAVLVASLAAACGKKKQASPANEQAYGSSSVVANSSGVNSLSKDSFVPDRVFFDFDSDVLTSDAQASLKLQAAYLIAQKTAIIVEGHADERGTDAYNMALGLKRAKAVKDKLVSYGMKPAHIKVVTYGKQKIEFPGDSEEAHAKNRRAVTVISVK